MLIARAPVRISFGGGGTDLEAYSGRFGGVVLSAAISRYCYVILTHGEPDGVQISSADMRRFNSRQAPQAGYGTGPASAAYLDGDLQLPWAVLHYFGIQRGVNLFLASEVPPGTGLGSSSTITVALCQALAALSDHPLSRTDLAEMAAQIEIEHLGMPIGRQDQYAAAFGGLNTLYFDPASVGGRVRVEPLPLAREVSAHLERHLMLFFTGTARHSASILRAQRQATADSAPPVLDALHTIKALALEMRACLQAGDLAGFGHLLDQAWHHKKRLAGGITTPAIDAAYAAACAAGAWGGKITGAGGGGFLLLCCPPERQAAVTAALHPLGLHRMTFRFARKGAGVLLNGGDVETEDFHAAGLSAPLYASMVQTSAPGNGRGSAEGLLPGSDPPRGLYD
jgi:D-glycero-alpha-D-manno-heptose-7-phosphate kinase